jgi:multiple sugar transport system substrate-binding protein
MNVRRNKMSKKINFRSVRRFTMDAHIKRLLNIRNAPGKHLWPLVLILFLFCSVGLLFVGGPPSFAGERIVITLWHQEEVPNRIKQWQSVIDDFNKSQSKYEVKQQVQNWATIYQKLPPAISAHNQPDIQFTIPDFTLEVRKTGVVQPVDSIVKELDELHHFIPAATQPYSYEGHMWAVPLYGMVQVLFYNKVSFRDAGLDPEKPPKTWDELLSYVKQLSGKGRYGIGVPLAKSLATDQVLYSFMCTNQGKDLFDASGNPTFNTPNNIKTIEFYAQLAKYSPPGISSWTWHEPMDAFDAGTIAMAVEKGMYIRTWGSVAKKPAADLGCAPVPIASGGERGSIYYSNGAMILTDDSQKIAGATEFFKFILEPTMYAKFLLAEPGLFLPLTGDGNTTAWSQSPELNGYSDQLNMLMEQSKYGYLFGFTSKRISPAIGAIAAQSIMAQVLQKVVIGNESAPKAVAWGQEQMEKIVAANK